MTVFSPNDTVRVADDAPAHAGLTGIVVDEQTYGLMFGYWILPATSDEPVWIPAEALIAVKDGEVR